MNDKQRLAHALKVLEAAKEAVYAAADVYVRVEIEKLSRRYPGRVVEWVAGMGTNSLTIHPATPRQSEIKAWDSVYGHVATTRFPFRDHLAQIEYDHNLKGLGDGVLKFKDGNVVDA